VARTHRLQFPRPRDLLLAPAVELARVPVTPGGTSVTRPQLLVAVAAALAVARTTGAATGTVRP